MASTCYQLGQNLMLIGRPPLPDMGVYQAQACYLLFGLIAPCRDISISFIAPLPAGNLPHPSLLRLANYLIRMAY